MDRNKGIWIVIACILVIGIVVTISTNQFVAKQEVTMSGSDTEAFDSPQVAKPEEPESADRIEAAKKPVNTRSMDMAQADTEAPLPELYGTEQESQAAFAGVQEDFASPQAVSEITPETEEESSAETETVMSPLRSARPQAPSAGAKEQDLQVYYAARLQDLDTQIKKMREADTEGTTYSMITQADKELKLWDNELNVIYNVVMDHLEEDSARQLAEEERQWMKLRDASALEACSKYSGGTLEGLEYTSSLAASTRERAYVLVNQYLVVLES